MDVYFNSSVGMTIAGTGVAGPNITNNVFERCRVSWTGAVATNEAKVGSQAAVTGTGSNVTPNTARAFSDLLTNYEWLMYLEVTGTKANFLTFAAAADTAARTVDWTTAIEV